MFCRQVDKNIQLELLEPQHTDELFRITDENRKYLGKWLPWVDSVQEPADTARFIKDCQEQWADNNGFQAAIRVDDKLTGVIGHHNIDWMNKKTSLGYWLAESAQGQGFMTKCCKEVINHAFKELRLHRVEIHCTSSNHKSRAIPERLEFQKEAILQVAAHINGQFVDLIIYAALSDKWSYSNQ